MKASQRRILNTLALWPTIVCLFLVAPLLQTTNAKKEARTASTKPLVNRTILQDDKETQVARSEAMEVTEIPCLSKPSSAPSKSPKGGPAPSAVAAAAFTTEAEPNDTFGTAQPLGTTPVRVRADLFRAPFSSGVDVDFYSFTAAAGDRVYAATMTGFAAGSTDTLLDIMDTNGTTVLEADDEDGAISGSASNIAGRVLAAAGTYFVRVRQFSTTSLSGTIRPYDLYVRVLSGSPTAETEPNNNGGTPNPVPANGWMSGVVSVAADSDTFSVSANAGDTVVAILDVDPERDSPEWNARLGIGIFNNNFLLVNGSAVGGTFDDANPSEALFMTVKAAGTYVVYVDEALIGGAANFTYNLSVSVIPGDTTRTCTNYAGTGGPITDLGITNFTLNIPDSKIIDNLQLSLNITHAATADLDVSLISPDGNEVVLFDDPPTVTAAAPQMDLTLDDEAAIPISNFGIHRGMKYTPELFGRLAYFKGMQAQGTWTLRVRDDLTANAGTLNSWSIDVCEAPPSVCAGQLTTLFSTDFEADAGGFTHSGTQDEWERGLPAFAPITTAHSGTNAFKTDLDNTYNASSNQDLLSPNINLVSASGVIKLSWWQKYQMESASFDPFWVEVREVGVPTNFRRLFEWKGATQTRSVGSPGVTVQMSAGWGLVEADISDFIGKNVEIRFHLETDGSGQFAGWAIDDVSVTACGGSVGGCTVTCPENITQTNDPNQCGAVVTYPPPSAEGDCGTVSCSPPSGSVFPVGTTSVTCTASGGQIEAPSGDDSTCNFTVTVTDDQPPSITCPANITVSNDPNQCGAVVNYPPPTITDNCPGTFTATCSPASGSFFPVGVTTVTCTVDGFGNGMKPTPNGQQCPNPETITHSSSQTVTPFNSVACVEDLSGTTTDNSYWRAFSLPAFGINGVFDVESVDIGIDEAISGGGGGKGVPKGAKQTPKGAGKPSISHNSNVSGPSGVGQPLTVNIYTSSQPFPTGFPGSLTLIGTTTTNVADQAATIINVPVTGTAGAGSQLVVEVFTPDGLVAGNAFFIGSNSAPETGPSYLSAVDCGITTPTTTAAIGFPDMHIVMNVNGCAQPVVGGGATCTFTVTVNDTQPPTITCPANVTAVTDQNVCPAPACQIVNFTTPIASDNCATPTVVCNPAAGTCFPVGVTTVTCTATDASGNTATCSFTVTTFDVVLQDDSDPSIILLWNSITGQYRFCCNGVVYTGVGKVQTQGCVFTLQHNPADRRVLGRVDKAVHAGTASIQAPAGTIRCTITDRNTLNDILTSCQ